MPANRAKNKKSKGLCLWSTIPGEKEQKQGKAPKRERKLEEERREGGGGGSGGEGAVKEKKKENKRIHIDGELKTC